MSSNHPTDIPVKASECDEAMLRLQSSISALQGLVDDLGVALHPVLTPSPVSDIGEIEEIKARAPLVDAIDARTGSIDCLRNQVEFLRRHLAI